MREFDERFLFHIGRGRCRIGLTVSTVFKEGLMLERIMDLQILLYLMTVLGTAGAIGMLVVRLTSEEPCERQKRQQT